MRHSQDVRLYVSSPPSISASHNGCSFDLDHEECQLKSALEQKKKKKNITQRSDVCSWV